MVMDACPSPQSVGREFVRQYYTLLNKAPSHLHRFYNNFSSFVHGGLDAPNRETLPVIGQKQIHNRIQQLNFRDCHAKISQVDAQATLGGGVVVQVTGELSNGGAPMRRFTQTFVLAAQSPKKYYVHNDIFRYQDIVVCDEEGSGEARSEGSETERGYFPPPPPAPLDAPPAPAAPFPPPPLVPDPAPAPLAPLDPLDPLADPEPEHNGHPHHHHDDLVQQMHSTSLGSSGGAPDPEPEPEELELEPELEQEPLTGASVCMGVGGPPLPPQPKTYANLLKQVSAQPRHPTHNQPPPAAAPAPAPARAPSPPRPRARPAPPHVQHVPTGVEAPPRGEPREAREGREGRGEPRAEPRSEPRGEPRDPAPRASRFPEAAQLFLGNVPPNATELQLKQIFTKFGTVAELRLLGRGAVGGGGGGGGGARGAAAYGFITYESAHAARNALNNQPIMFEATKLNLEEKKRRGEAPSRPPRNNYRR